MSKPIDPATFTNASGKTLETHKREEDARKSAEFAAADAAGRQALVDLATAYHPLDTSDEQRLIQLLAASGPYRVLLAVASCLDREAGYFGRRKDWVNAARRQSQAQDVRACLVKIADSESLAPQGK